MIAALALRLVTKAPTAIRKLGHVGDSVALWSRATRQRRAWQPHEQRCHGLIEEIVAGMPRRRTVAVLGSGLVRDVPITTLIARFERVVLVDAVHLPQIRFRFRKTSVEFVTLDITGCAAWVTGNAQGRGDPLGRLRDDPRLDLVISANCLSQLPLAFDSWLEDNPDQAGIPKDLPRRIVQWHLDDLRQFGCAVTLVTDVHQDEIARNQARNQLSDLLYGETLPPPDLSWDWEVAPFGEKSRRFRYVHHVQAYRDFRRSFSRD